MLRLRKLTDYGTVMAAHMARAPERVFSAAELAAASGVGLPTASKILKLLARAALLQSVRGAKGGYVLARPAAQISLAQVIDAMEGPLGVTECSAGTGLCPQESACAIRDGWLSVDRIIRRALGETSLADLARPLPPSGPVPLHRLPWTGAHP